MKKQTDYDEWRQNKISQIQNATQSTFAEATMIFLLQDIAYKLSMHYLGTMPKNVPPEGANKRNKRRSE